MKYLYKDNKFSIQTTQNGKDITLWEIQTDTPVPLDLDNKEEIPLTIFSSPNGYVPMILANDWFIICNPTEQIFQLNMDPIIFFDEKQHVFFKQNDILQIETKIKSLSKYISAHPPLAVLTLNDCTSTIRLNDEQKAISYKKDMYMPASANSSHVSEYYNIELDTTDQIFHHKTNGRTRVMHLNIGKWNEHMHIDYLDKNLTHCQYQKPLAKLLYHTPTWAKGTLITVLAGLMATTISKCQNSKTEPQNTPQAVKVVSHTLQAPNNKTLER